MAREFITVTYATTPEQKKKLELWAKEEICSVSYLVRKAVQEALEARKKEKQEKAQTGHFEDL